MNFLYKDIDYCNYIIHHKNLITFDNFYSDCMKLCAYYRKIKFLKKNEIKNELLDFFTTKFGYNVEIEKYINKTINNYTIKLVQIDKISIDKNITDYITNLDISYESKKILFSMIVYCITMQRYIYEYKGITLNYYLIPHNMSYKKIYDLSNVKFSKKNIKYINELVNKKLIYVYKNNDIGIKCINNFHNSNIFAFDICYFNENYGLYYDYYTGKNIRFCEICNTPFRPNSNKAKYCKEHQGYQAIKTKIIICVDCGKKIEVNSRNNTQNRCKECYKQYRKKQLKKAKERYKNNIKQNKTE